MIKPQSYQHNNNTIYNTNDIETVLLCAVNSANLRGNSKGVYTYNIPCAFDIETSSFYRDSNGSTYDYQQAQNINTPLEKCSVMYVWQFNINGYIIIGRTWREFVSMIDTVRETLGLNDKRKLIIYVHNLSYEFQFIRTLFDWDKVFSLDQRKPIYAQSGGIEFRCSYLLSGYSLDRLGKQLTKYKCAKLTGGLDYSLIRHTSTPLAEEELKYCIEDTRVVCAYIQEQIDTYHGITNLPLTKTGFVRKYCREKCMKYKGTDGKKHDNFYYIDLIRHLSITGMHEFDMLQRAFAGGFTHANADKVRDTLHHVASYDFTSSYPYVMVSEKFPMSTGVRVSIKNKEQFEKYCKKYCCIFDVEFTNIFAKVTHENPISSSKCYVLEKECLNNGRVVCAGKLCTTLTNIDYPIIKQFYSWETCRIGEMYVYRAEYLPREFVGAILDLYQKKTTLKGVEGAEVEYLQSKEMLNSCYGMCVTNPLRDEFVYDGVWDTKQLSESERVQMLNKYNTSKNRFLFYPWGVFVTAYARRNLFTGILTCGDDYCYSDTDSIKIEHHDRYKDYFDGYNKRVEEKLKRACTHHGFDFGLCAPRTIKGIAKMLGVWDYEGVYDDFKTLGAKRYMTRKNGVLSITVSGVNKKRAIPYLEKTYGNEVFEKFDNYLVIPPSGTGKNIHTYIDYLQVGRITDYLGNTEYFENPTGVHLEPTGYCLSLSVMYLNYLIGKKLKDD